MSSLDGNIFQGRLLHILPGRRAIEPDHDDDNVEEGATSEYKKKEKKTQKILPMMIVIGTRYIFVWTLQ